MDAVPTLCATSTVGVAAIGLAFGRLSTSDPRPRSNKRKAGDIMSGSFYQPFAPSTPTARPQTSSAPTSQFPKPGFLRRPQSASFARSNLSQLESGLGVEGITEERDWRASAFVQREYPATEQLPSGLLGSGSGTAKSSWLRRMSTFSSFQNESPTSSTSPGTPSLSFSNGSSAPIIHSSASPAIQRNRLVKRASSQRTLHTSGMNRTNNSKSQLPTLRRPATSHQRSATIQEQLGYSNADLQHELPRPSFVQDDSVLEVNDDESLSSMLQWQPFFQRREIELVRETPLKQDMTMRRYTRNGYVRTIVPVNGDLPSLLKADSITKLGSDEFTQYPSVSAFSTTPSTPLATEALQVPSANHSNDESVMDQDLKPRSSFSMSELFSTPSPSLWKIGRNSSLRRKKEFETGIIGRRVTSAPQPLRENRGHSSEYPDLSSQSPVIGETATRAPSFPLPPLNRFSAFEIDLTGSVKSEPPSPPLYHRSSPISPTSPNPILISNPASQPTSKAKSHRPSRVPSDRASTLVGSDNENSRTFPGDGDEIDCRSDTIYDSVRTGATGSSHSGIRGPRIETVFDSSPPAELLKQNLTDLQEKLSNSNIVEDFIAEEEEMIRTPLGAEYPGEDELSTPSRFPLHISSSSNIGSSPPPLPMVLQRDYIGGHDFDNVLDEEEAWSMEDEEPVPWDHTDARDAEWDRSLPTKPHIALADRFSDVADLDGDRPKSNIFEWSERSHHEKENQQGSTPRPRTVHGKQSTDRGSRTTGRRGVSALHLRSQSVPLSPENSTHRNINNTSKLDAWMLGGKGVSEDWDGDFEFDEPLKSTGSAVNGAGNHETMEHSGMLVPRSILERQASVHGQFGQVKELTLLVEELKRLRHQAHSYGIMHGQSSELWKEAEGIINLATLDDEQDLFPPHSPNSPSFDSDLFEDETSTVQRRQRLNSSDTNENFPSHQDHSTSRPVISQSSPPPSKLATPPRGRPRQDSAANAKSVLEHIHQQRSPLGLQPGEIGSAPKKLPFDTTSLRDLVTRAGVVTRALKEIVRRAESTGNVDLTSERSPSNPPDPAFSQIFHQPSGSPQPSKSPRSVKSKSSNHNSFLGGPIKGNDNDINGHMKMMTVA